VLQSLHTLSKQSHDSPDPLYRLFFREGSIGSNLLGQVRKDLSDVIKVCEGGLKQTNNLRALMSSLTKGEFLFFLSYGPLIVLLGAIPVHWRRYKVQKGMSVTEWIPNLARRLAQLDSISGLDNLNNIEVWLGGLFFPEAYITATRQAVAHRKKWSLETLHLQMDIERVNDPEGFILDGDSVSQCIIRIY
jgi:dynein heavy chain 1, cytosolic